MKGKIEEVELKQGKNGYFKVLKINGNTFYYFGNEEFNPNEEIDFTYKKSSKGFYVIDRIQKIQSKETQPKETEEPKQTKSIGCIDIQLLQLAVDIYKLEISIQEKVLPRVIEIYKRLKEL